MVKLVSKLKSILKAVYMVMYYAHEGIISTVLLVAFNALATEKMNISALLKCFIIHLRGTSKQIKKRMC